MRFFEASRNATAACPQCTCTPIVITSGEINLILLVAVILILGFGLGYTFHKKGWI
jgi:hypothetical protein